MKFTSSCLLLFVVLSAWPCFTLGASCVNPSAPDARCPTLNDFSELEELIVEWIEASTCSANQPGGNGGGGGGMNNVQPQQQTDNINNGMDICDLFSNGPPRPRALGPRLIRHAFHDAVGHLDGFVDLTNPENLGLDVSATVLDAIYDGMDFTFSTGGETISELLNKADFAAWAYIAAVRHMMAQRFRAVVPHIPPTIGRRPYKLEDGPFEPEIFPSSSGHAGAEEIMIYFQDNFGFDAVQTAVIMGAHTLGSANPNLSGYAGPWVRATDTLDNEYYEFIIDPPRANICNNAPGQEGCQGWELVNTDGRNPARKPQWSRDCDFNGDDCRGLMLHTDVSMVYNIDPYICTESDIADDLVTNCRIPGQIRAFPDGSPCGELTDQSRILLTCFDLRQDVIPNDEISNQVSNLADDNQLFIDSFAEVFNLLITHRNPEGVQLEFITEEMDEGNMDTIDGVDNAGDTADDTGDIVDDEKDDAGTGDAADDENNDTNDEDNDNTDNGPNDLTGTSSGYAMSLSNHNYLLAGGVFIWLFVTTFTL